MSGKANNEGERNLDRKGKDTGTYRTISKILVSPHHINFHGSIFGGDLFSIMDQCAYMISRESYPDHDFVTRHSQSEFIAPLFPGQIVEIQGRLQHHPPSSALEVDLKALLEKSTVAKMRFIMVSIKKKGSRFLKDPIRED